MILSDVSDKRKKKGVFVGFEPNDCLCVEVEYSVLRIVESAEELSRR